MSGHSSSAFLPSSSVLSLSWFVGHYSSAFLACQDVPPELYETGLAPIHPNSTGHHNSAGHPNSTVHHNPAGHHNSTGFLLRLFTLPNEIQLRIPTIKWNSFLFLSHSYYYPAGYSSCVFRAQSLRLNIARLQKRRSLFHVV